MMLPRCYKDYGTNLQGFTNNLEAYYQHMWIDGFYEKFNKRVIWYARRQSGVTSEIYDCLTILCIYFENQFQTILCAQRDNCTCSNGLIHAHLDPICLCEFPANETRVLAINQDSNR